MRNINQFFRRFVQDDRGAAAVEYALMVGLIAAVVGGTVTTLATKVTTVLTTTTNAL